ncbi:MAG: Gldg family protein [Verrucomicrobiota bacterium]
MTKDLPPDAAPDPSPATGAAPAIPGDAPAAETPPAPAPDPDAGTTAPPFSPPEVPHIQRLRIAFNVGIQLLLGLVLYGLVNYLASRHFKQWDNTYEKRFTLAPTTVEFLKKITVPVRITVLAVRGNETEKDLSALLQQYKDAMKGKLEVKVIDTLRDTAAWEAFKVQQGLRTKTNFDKNGVLIQADMPGATTANPEGAQRWITEAALYDVDPKTLMPQAFKGESLLNSAIHGVTTINKPKLGIAAGLGVPRRLPDGSSAFDVLLDICTLQNIDFQPYSINNSKEKLDSDALIWIAPEDGTDQEITRLREYLETPGHSLCVMLNPEHATPLLDKFLTDYGVVPLADRVMSSQSRTTGVVKNFLVEGARFLDGSPLTTGIVSEAVTLTGQTRSLRIETGTEKQRSENIEVKPILCTPVDDYWGETDYTAYNPVFNKGVDNGGSGVPVNVIAAAERGAAKDPRVQMKSSRLIVFGNSGFADPDTMSKVKYDFLIRSINWMMHRDVVAPNDSTTDKAKHKFAIQIKPEQWQRIFWTTTVILPLAALMTGLMVWSSRRG